MLTLTVALAGILMLFDRYYDASVLSQFQETGRSIQKIQDEQFAALQPFTRAMNVPKIRIAIEEGDPRTDLRPEVDATLRLLKPPCDGLSIADHDGRFLIRATPGPDAWDVVPVDGDLAEGTLLKATRGYFVSGEVLYYGLCQRLQLGETHYGYVVFWNRVDRELQTIKAIHPRVGLEYRVDGSPRTEEKMVEMTVGGESMALLTESIPPDLIRVFMFPLGEKHEFVWKVTRTALAVALGSLGVAIFISFFISRGLSKPILSLVEATREIDRGNYQARVHIPSRDELGILGSSFNEMAEGLEEKEKRKTIMRKTLSADVEKELMSTQQVTLGGTVADATIMFVDIRGFTTLSEGMPPSKVVEMLNEYMSMADRVIQRHYGFVSKFIGDGILALFGMTRNQAQAPLNAVQAGLGLLEELQKLNEARRNRAEREIRIGVGINTGEVLKGNVGSEQRLEFTVIGEQVNLAARLCSNAKPQQILISDACYARVADEIQANRLEPIAVKGFSRPIQVYEVVSVHKPA